MKLLLFMLLVPLTSFAWTLNTNFGASFKDNNVKVFIDGNTTCARNNLTVYDLEDLVKSAVKNYWNTVPTSNLRLAELSKCREQVLYCFVPMLFA